MKDPRFHRPDALTRQQLVDRHAYAYPDRPETYRHPNHRRNLALGLLFVLGIVAAAVTVAVWPF